MSASPSTIVTPGADSLQGRVEAPFDGETLISVVDVPQLTQTELEYLHFARAGGSTYGGMVCQEVVVPFDEGEPDEAKRVPERWLRIYNKAFGTVLLLNTKRTPSEGEGDAQTASLQLADNAPAGAGGGAQNAKEGNVPERHDDVMELGKQERCEILSFFTCPPETAEKFSDVFPVEDLFFLEGWGSAAGNDAERRPCFIDRASRDRCLAGGVTVGWRALRVPAQDHAETGQSFLFAVEGCVMKEKSDAPTPEQGTAMDTRSEAERAFGVTEMERDEEVIKGAFENVLKAN